MTRPAGIRRRVKKRVARVLPEWAKARVRGRLFGFRPAAVALDPVFTADARGPLVTFGPGIVFRFREVDRQDLDYHLRTNGASIEEMAGFLDLARRARLLFDVGALKGVFGIAFCRSGPDRRAVLYEPSPIARAEAAALVALNGCADAVVERQTAVGREAGRVGGQLYADGFVSVASGAAPGRPMAFEVTTIDAEAARFGDPDVIKIDVEGHEYDVILGARAVLARRRPALSLELHLDQLDARGTPARMVVEELLAFGYRFRSSTGRPLAPHDVYDSVNAVLRVIAE